MRMQSKRYNPPMQRADTPTVGHVPFAADGLPITFTTGKGTEMFGAIVIVKLTCKSMKQFARACHAARAVFKSSEHEDIGVWSDYGLPCPIDGVDAYEVYASYENLRELVEHDSVKRWHQLGYLAMPRKGSGSMPKKR